MKDKKLDDWVLLLNPHAGSGNGAQEKDNIISYLKEKEFGFETYLSEYPQHAISLTQELIAAGYRKFMVAGGDGTLNEVTNGIFIQKIIPPEAITVAVIPLGTGNDWVRTFDIPTDYRKAINRIIKEKTVYQDVGRITFGQNGSAQTRYFANMAGFGFNAMVAEKVNQLKDKGRKGVRVYVQSLAGSLFRYRICRTHVHIDNEEIEDLIFSTSIGIGKYSGGGLMQAPNAIPTKGEFQVTIIRKVGIWGILKNFKGLYNGTFVRDRRVSTHLAKYVRITADRLIPGEADGEVLGYHTFEIEIIPQQLNVVCGKHPAFEDE